MLRNKILIAIDEAEQKRLIQSISKDALPLWTDHITIKGFAKPAGLASRKAHIQSIEDELSRLWNSEGYLKIFVDSNLRVDEDRLADEGAKIRVSSRGSISSEINEELKKRGLHWLTYSEKECRKSGICFQHPQAWKQQFDELGCGWVAEGLLKQLRVISDSEVRQALHFHEADVLGLRVAHAYVKDSDPGSSSLNIKDLLEHTQVSEIFEVDLTVDGSKIFAEHDVVYFYEDGLWSGVELVRRLEQIKNWSATQSRSVRVVFRFAVTSDAGLYAGRHFIQQNKLVTVEIARGVIEHHRFLKDGAIAQLSGIKDASAEVIRKGLDKQAIAFAFRDDQLWRGRAAEAQEICRAIGVQLARPWLQRTIKADENIETKTEKWSLGAFGFASVMAFSKSVPKPVLPLIWLNGDVTVGVRTVNWKPLFWDSRRTGAQPPSAMYWS